MYKLPAVQEPGIARFDVLQDNDNPTHFVLVEIYRSQEATVAHEREVQLRLRYGSCVGIEQIDRGFDG